MWKIIFEHDLGKPFILGLMSFFVGIAMAYNPVSYQASLHDWRFGHPWMKKRGPKVVQRFGVLMILLGLAGAGFSVYLYFYYAEASSTWPY